MKSPTPSISSEDQVESVEDEVEEETEVQQPEKPDKVAQEFTLMDLTMKDVMAICEKDLVLKEVVWDFFHFATSGHGIDVHLDAQFLQSYPLRRNRSVYRDMGKNTHSLTLSHINESQLELLIGHFPNTKSLQLDNVTVVGQKKWNTLPAHLKSLVLIDCCIDRKFLELWFSSLTDSLETLHISALTCEFPGTGELTFLSSLPNLRQLTIDRMKIESFDYTVSAKCPLEELTLRLDARSLTLRSKTGGNVRRLTIETNTNLFLSGDWERLEYFALRCGYETSTRDHLRGLRCVDTLSTLILHIPCQDVGQLLRFKNLRELKMPCKWFEVESVGERLKVLNHLETIEYITHAPPNGGCAFEESLVDIRMRIFQYLPAKDVLSFGQVDPKLLHLWNPKECLSVDKSFLKSFPLPASGEDSAFYDNLGAAVLILKVASVPEEDFLQLLDRFGNIKELQLEQMSLKNVEGIAKIPLVEKLSIGYCPEVDERYWDALFRRLDENLTKLTVEEPEIFPLLQLHHLHEFSSLSYKSAETMGAFLSQNGHMKRLHLNSHGSKDPFLTPVLPNQDGDDGEAEEGEVTSEQKLQLKELHLNVTRLEQIFPLLTVVAPQSLHSISVAYCSSKSQIFEQLAAFVHLQKLQLDIAVDWGEQNLDGLSAFQELTHLSINGTLTEAVAMKLIKALPHLTRLDLGSQVEPFSVAFQRNLCGHLRMVGRKLSITSNDSFFRWQSRMS